MKAVGIIREIKLQRADLEYSVLQWILLMQYTYTPKGKTLNSALNGPSAENGKVTKYLVNH